VREAKELVAAAKKSGKVFALTHNYTGYPMIRQARAMIAAGELGEIRVVQAEYAQDWLTEPLEKTGQKQAAWRTDPKRSGAGGALGDIGTHAYNLACFVTGLDAGFAARRPDRVREGPQARRQRQYPLRWKGGAKGMLWASQVAVGNENG
jgi:predicted dehydrogenase